MGASPGTGLFVRCPRYQLRPAAINLCYWDVGNFLNVLFTDPPKFELPLWTQWVLPGLLVASQTKRTKLHLCAVRCMNLELKTRAGEIQSDGCWSCACRSHHFWMLTRAFGAPLPLDDSQLSILNDFCCASTCWKWMRRARRERYSREPSKDDAPPKSMAEQEEVSDWLNILLWGELLEHPLILPI